MINSEYSEIKDFLNEECKKLNLNRLIDDKFYQESYIPTREDVQNMNEAQLHELSDSNRYDFNCLDSIRDYEMSINEWTDVDELEWRNLHKRFIITEKLCRSILNSSQSDLTTDINVFSAQNLDSMSIEELIKLRNEVKRQLFYSPKYDTINFDMWNNEYEDILNYLEYKYNQLNTYIISKT